MPVTANSVRSICSSTACICSGRCVVASFYGANPETVEHQVSGLLSPVDDIAALAADLARIAADPALRPGHG